MSSLFTFDYANNYLPTTLPSIEEIDRLSTDDIESHYIKIKNSGGCTNFLVTIIKCAGKLAKSYDDYGPEAKTEANKLMSVAISLALGTLQPKLPNKTANDMYSSLHFEVLQNCSKETYNLFYRVTEVVLAGRKFLSECDLFLKETQTNS